MQTFALPVNMAGITRMNQMNFPKGCKNLIVVIIIGHWRAKIVDMTTKSDSGQETYPTRYEMPGMKLNELILFFRKMSTREHQNW